MQAGDTSVVEPRILTAELLTTLRRVDEERAYLLVGECFPDASLKTEDVVGTWAGIRPLATAPAGTNPSSISREHRISRDKAGVLVITGGKLTTYRAMAAEVVNHIELALSRKPRPAPTDQELLP